MRRLFNWLTLAVTVSALLVTGCRSPRSASAVRAEQSEVENEVTLDMRARAHAHYAAAVIHDLNDEPEAALNDYLQAAENDPNNEALILEVSRRLILAKQPEKALELLQVAASRPDASGEIYARLGLVCMQLGKTSQAIEANRTAIKKSPTGLAGYQNLFQSYLLMDQPDKALAVLDDAAKQPDTDVYFLTGLAEIYADYMTQFPAQRADIEPKTIAVLDRAAALNPSTVQLQLRLADTYAKIGEGAKAAPIYENTLDRLKDVPFLHDSLRAKLADIYFDEHDYKRASEQLEELVRSDPSNAQAYYFLGHIAYIKGHWKEAADYLEKAVLFSPRFEQACYDLAGAQIAAGQGSDAIMTLDTARTKFPQSFLMEYLFGVAYGQTKAYSEAIQHFTAAEVMAKTADTNLLTKEFYFQGGMVFERGGQYAQAAEYFQKAIDISPNFAEALNYLGYMWADHGENLQQARELIERALKVEPDSAAYVDSLGWVLFKLGQPQPALKQIRRAIELSEKPDPELYNHLGDIYAAMNEPEKAREAWDKSLSIEPNEEIQKKLDAMQAK